MVWTRVDNQNPCPICEKDSWCGIVTDMQGNKLVRCMRVESKLVSESNGGEIGWLHKLGDYISDKVIRKEPEKENTDFTSLAQWYYNKRTKEDYKFLSSDLGVSERSLDAMRVGGGGNRWYTIPSWDEKGRVVGISKRFQNGSKSMVKHTSNSGVFLFKGWQNWTGTVYIVEGASDVMAMFDLGLRSLGRPSNTSWVMVKKILQANNITDFIVVGENDRRVEENCSGCIGCNKCFPGLYGARHVSKKLGCDFIMPSGKDIRSSL